MGAPEPGPVLRDRLHELAQRVRRADRAVRDDDPEGVHDLRVAMRRTRSLLRTFRPLLEPDAVPGTERMRAELRWAAGELSGVRDLEVAQGRLVKAGERAGPLPESVTARLEQHREQADTAAQRQVVGLLASDRYARMLDELESLAGRLEWDQVTDDAARERLRKDWRRMRRQARAAEESRQADDRELALHEVRKAAKRARYAAEALAPAFGDRAQRMAGVAERVQETLGDHRDTLLTRALLHRLADERDERDERHAAAGEHVFALGRLDAFEQAAGDEALREYDEARAEMDRKRHRRWLG